MCFVYKNGSPNSNASCPVVDMFNLASCHVRRGAWPHRSHDRSVVQLLGDSVDGIVNRVC